jgi:DNA-binding transcriptional LysR family regulator
MLAAGAFKKDAAMELRSLHYFVRIAELGSITRAAAHLHVAQPALTRHVQRLEEELNVALFTRANRGVRLTEAGQKLLDGATPSCATSSAPATRSAPRTRTPAARSSSASPRPCARCWCPSCSRACAATIR